MEDYKVIKIIGENKGLMNEYIWLTCVFGDRWLVVRNDEEYASRLVQKSRLLVRLINWDKPDRKIESGYWELSAKGEIFKKDGKWD